MLIFEPNNYTILNVKPITIGGNSMTIFKLKNEQDEFVLSTNKADILKAKTGLQDYAAHDEQARVGYCEVQGERESQEDRVIASTIAFNKDETPAVALRQTVALLQAECGQEQDQGSTLLAAVIDTQFKKIYTANVGDSTAYLVTINKDTNEVLVKALNEQHNPQTAMEQERLRAFAKENNIPLDENGKKITSGDESGISVSRSIGDRKFEAYGLTHEMDLTVTELEEIADNQYQFLLVACDGLTERMQSEQQLVSLIQKVIADQHEQAPEEIARQLAMLRLENRSDLSEETLRASGDNISVMVSYLPKYSKSLTEPSRILAVFDGHGGSTVSQDLSDKFLPTFHALSLANHYQFDALADWPPEKLAVFAKHIDPEMANRLLLGQIKVRRFLARWMPNWMIKGFQFLGGERLVHRTLRDTLLKAKSSAIAEIMMEHTKEGNTQIWETIIQDPALVSKLDGPALLILAASKNAIVQENLNLLLNTKKTLQDKLDAHLITLMQETKKILQTSPDTTTAQAECLAKIKALGFIQVMRLDKEKCERLALQLMRLDADKSGNQLALLVSIALLAAKNTTQEDNSLEDFHLATSMQRNNAQLMRELFNEDGISLLVTNLSSLNKEQIQALFAYASTIRTTGDKTLLENIIIHQPDYVLYMMMQHKTFGISHFGETMDRQDIETLAMIYHYVLTFENDSTSHKQEYLNLFKQLHLSVQLTLYYQIRDKQEEIKQLNPYMQIIVNKLANNDCEESAKALWEFISSLARKRNHNLLDPLVDLDKILKAEHVPLERIQEISRRIFEKNNSVYFFTRLCQGYEQQSMAAAKDSLILQALLQDPMLLEAIISGISLNIDASFEFLKMAALSNPDIFLDIGLKERKEMPAIANEERYRELITIATEAKHGLEAQTAKVLEKSKTIEDSIEEIEILPNVSNHHATTFGALSSKKGKEKEKEKKDEVDNNDENKAKPN
jgi:serine/threonine protein phosphatase PrpC